MGSPAVARLSRTRPPALSRRSAWLWDRLLPVLPSEGAHVGGDAEHGHHGAGPQDRRQRRERGHAQDAYRLVVAVAAGLTAHKRPVRAQDKEEALFGMATSGPIGERLLAGERDQAVRDTLSRLPRRWQRLLELLMADPPASYAEISDELGLPLGTIGPTRGRALARLRELLQVSEADTDSQMNPCTPDDGEAHQDWTTAGELVHAQCG